MRSSYPPPPPRFSKATNERPQEDDRDNVARPPTTAAARKKGIGVRAWLLMDSTGQSQVVEAGKHAIMCRTGLPARDLRILDPLLSYPSTVLGRERAIVINLEHIKAIVTSREVLLLNSKDPSVAPFVEELERRLMGRRQAIKAQEGNGTGSKTCLCDPAEIQSQVAGPINFPRDHDEVGNPSGKPGLDNQDGNKVLPFEFVALEACLEAACSCLENEANILEQEAQTALDKLTSKISTLNLERVREIKSRLVAITGRAQKVRDDLEHLLDDDEDMAEMYLTEKLVQQHLENSSDLPLNERDDIYDDDFQPELDDSIPAEVSLRAYGADSYEIDNGNADTLHDHPSNMPRALIGDNHAAHTSTTRSVINKQFGVGELEMLLEAYFVQIDGTLNKLSTLKEYVDDTEDYINIMLDDKQNQLLKMAVVLTTGTLIVSCFVVTTAVFGMNIHIELFNEGGSVGMHKWLWTTFGGTAACIFAYVSAISWFKYKRLIE